MATVAVGSRERGGERPSRITFGSLQLYLYFFFFFPKHINGMLLLHSRESSCVGVLWWLNVSIRLTDYVPQYVSRILGGLRTPSSWTVWLCTRTLSNTLGQQVRVRSSFNTLTSSYFVLVFDKIVICVVVNKDILCSIAVYIYIYI